MTDIDTQTGPSVTLDPNGHVILPYLSIAAISDVEYNVTPATGPAFIVPKVQFVGGDPGVQTSPGTCILTESYARSIGII
jgi:hypothetical protein